MGRNTSQLIQPATTLTSSQSRVPSPNLFRGHSEVVVGKWIIGLNVAVFILTVATGGGLLDQDGVIYKELVLWGPFVQQGQWWRLVTGAFMHAGIVHIGSNMLLFWFLAQEMEYPLGRLQFVMTYAASVMGGSLGVMLMSPIDPTLGASGGVFGLMGALVVLQLRAKQNPWNSGLGGLIVINVFLTFAIPGISAGGHLGGLGAGALAGLIIEPIPWGRADPKIRAVFIGALSIGLAVAAVLVAHWLVPGALERELLRRGGG